MNNSRNKNPELYDLRTDIMRYKKNSASFWLCILAICFDVAMFLIIYKDANCVPNWALGIDLLINIIMILAFFLTAEKTKAYTLNGGYTAYVLGVIQIARIFWIPLTYFIEWVNRQGEIAANPDANLSSIGLSSTKFIWCVALLIASAVASIIAGYICNAKHKRLEEHFKKEAK